MSSQKIVSAEQAIKLIHDGDTVGVGGFVGCMHPEEISIAIEDAYLKSGAPKDLTLVYCAGQGDGKEKGLNHLGHEGLVKRVVGGHWNLAPKLQQLAMDNKIEAYNLPQGTICHLIRDIAGGRPGTITHVGLGTFVDPDLDGGKLNAKTTEDIVHKIKIHSKEYLLYDAFPIDVAIVRGTYADTDGNISFEREAVELEMLPLCQAAKNSGGRVIAQVENVVEKGTLDARLVKIPGFLVDAIVIAKPENHMQTFGTQYNPAMSGEIRVPVTALDPLPLDIRKVIGRRAAMELPKDSITNLGIGMPEAVASVAAEEGISDTIILTLESGPNGGIPQSGNDFGAAVNADCVLNQPSQFDFYDGGGIDVAYLGLAQMDKHGNVNVSKFGPRIAGCGGFINITQNAKKVVYCGTFTAGGLSVSVGDGELHIDKEGTIHKLLADVEHITFSGKYAVEAKQPVLYVTERAVFQLTKKGVELIEIAPGVDLDKDVLGHMDFKPIVSDYLKKMDPRIFTDEKMGVML
ncbi:MAG: acyl CoA:acetate/3-ketoacid CoA transferase [Clostridiales Family XIII bacterium]|jgi:propionate CoA-transferase|nr:acyl CoA:acetate/3-ketoacid CoA transferase [Clostridiales Family XIII bacterium]